MKASRYIFTAAQSNTDVHPQFWANLLAFREHLGARLFVGTYTYNKRGMSAKGAKRKTSAETDKDGEWWDDKIADYIWDERKTIAPGLEWCGEMQIMPTAVDPLSGMEGYTGRQSSIFPHAKLAMASVPSGGAEELTKLVYTTGACTVPNYIQKKAGLKAQFHHSVGALLVEYDPSCGWFARQISADHDGNFQDLLTEVRGGHVLPDPAPVEAVIWGDIHVAQLDGSVYVAGWLGEDAMLDTLRPKYQFFHDLFDGQSLQKHSRAKNLHHQLYRVWAKGKWSVEAELRDTRGFLERTYRDWCRSVVVNSNHDQMLDHWLQTTSHRDDQANALFYLKAELFIHDWMRLYGDTKYDPPLLQWALNNCMGEEENLPVTFLNEDESFIICPDANGGIECGMHGHRGPNGGRGMIRNIARMGRKSVIGHSHSAGIFEGCYQVGLSGKVQQGYNKGPSSWTHTHCVVYPNGKRTLVTMHKGQWRA